MPELVCSAADRDAWPAARRGGVTATDIVTILGLSPWDSPYSLFWRKLGQVPEQEDNDRLRLGRDLEPIISQRWQEEHHRALRAGREGSVGLYCSQIRPWQLATLDRILETGTGLQPVELKSWADADRQAWEDGPPARVRAQVLWQMDVMDVPAGHVGVLFLPSGEFRSHVIEHADHAPGIEWRTTEGREPLCPACDDILLMREAGREFHNRIIDNHPPDPDASAATLAAVRARFPRHDTKEAEVDAGTWEAWCHFKEQAANYEEAARKLESQLREQAGEARRYLVDGQPVITRVVSEAQVKAHVRHQDYLRRINRKDDSD